LVSKNHFGAVRDSFDQQARQRTARDRHKTAACQFRKHPCAEAGNTPAGAIDDPGFPHVIADPVKLITKAHALGDVVAEAPKSDDIPSCAQRGCVLEQRRPKSAVPEPEGQRRPGHSHSGNQNRLSTHTRKLVSMSVAASSVPPGTEMPSEISMLMRSVRR